MTEDTTYIPEDKKAESAAYLRIFGPREGCREVDLPDDRTVIGRGEESTIRLNDPGVSRRHAVIFTEGADHYLEDCGSRSGTIVNGRHIRRLPLRHGDTILIAQFVLQYRTDERSEEEKQISRTFRGHFSHLPSSIRVRYRLVHHSPHRAFQKGDTLPVGEGGILLNMQAPPPPNICIQIELTWPDETQRMFMGEPLGAMPNRERVICLKLHRMSDDKFQRIVERAQLSNWISE